MSKTANGQHGQVQGSGSDASHALSKYRIAARGPHHVGLVLILVIFIVTALGFAVVTPFNKGSDEGINLDYIEFIALNGRLPVTYAEREQVGPKANWPALYHVILAGTGNLLGIDVGGAPYIKIFWDSFRYRTLDIEQESTWYLATEDQAWPYYGRYLIWQMGRWFSVILSLVTLWLVYRVLLEIFPGRPWRALAGTALLAFIPAFIFIGSALNEDALVAALATLYFWMLIQVINRPHRLWPYWIMGLALGLSVTAKYTTIVLPLEVILVVGVLAWQEGHSWRWWLQRVVIVGGTAIFGAAWWFGWNLWFLNEVEELGWTAGLLRPIFTGGTDVTLARLGNFFSGGEIGLGDLPEDIAVGAFPEWLRDTFLSFWGVTIGGWIPFYPYAYVIVGLLMGLVVFGLWRAWQRESSSRKWLVLLLFHVGLFLILPLVRFGLSRRLGQTAQGRHILIPAAAAIAGLLIWGLASAIPQRWQRWAFSAFIVGFVIWTGMHLVRLESFAPPLLPLRTWPPAATWLPQSANARFGGALGGVVELVSYDAQPLPETGRLSLELSWRSVAYANQSYRLLVTALNSEGKTVSHWMGYNGDGRTPTLSWDPGDAVFDRLVLPLPNLPAGDYTVQLQLLGHNGPLPIDSQVEDGASETVLSLVDLSLDRPSNFNFSRHLTVDTPSTGSVRIPFTFWKTGGAGDAGDMLYYRYPATITVITDNTGPSETGLKLYLVDPAGEEWPAVYDDEGNIHTFVIGPRWTSGAYRLRMVLQNGTGDIGQITSEPLINVENWWERRFEAPEVAVPGQANFANQVHFLGYKLPQPRVRAGEAFPLTLYWQAPADRAPQADFIQFNHLLDGSGQLWGGYDRRPLEYYSTLLWAPGEVVVDGYAVPVDADAPPGEYYLSVGYYLTVGESAVNLPLVVDGEISDSSSVIVGPVTVIR